MTSRRSPTVAAPRPEDPRSLGEIMASALVKSCRGDRKKLQAALDALPDASFNQAIEEIAKALRAELAKYPAETLPGLERDDVAKDVRR